MATKWVDVRGERREENKCRPCQAGAHAERGCVGRACTCFCQLPGVRPSLAPAQKRAVLMEQLRPSIGGVLDKLREAGVTCRGTASYKLVWKPRPSEMPAPLRMMIRSYRRDLTLVLFPSEEEGRPQSRPYWSRGALSPCVDCDELTATVDPLGEPRHSWCGWLGSQRPHN